MIYGSSAVGGIHNHVAIVSSFYMYKVRRCNQLSHFLIIIMMMDQVIYLLACTKMLTVRLMIVPSHDNSFPPDLPRVAN